MAEDKIRFEFKKTAGETDPDKLQELFLVGHTHLDTLGLVSCRCGVLQCAVCRLTCTPATETQVAHLNELAKMDMRAIKGVKNTLEESEAQSKS